VILLGLSLILLLAISIVSLCSGTVIDSADKYSTRFLLLSLVGITRTLECQVTLREMIFSVVAKYSAWVLQRVDESKRPSRGCKRDEARFSLTSQCRRV
jgi:hypothetical protein